MMGIVTDWTRAPASEMARELRARRVSSEELVEACLARIEKVNPSLNAVVATCPERARREARERDRESARGESRGPLHGVPMTLKDSHQTEGVVSSGGTLGLRAHVPARDSTTTARLRAAGAVLLGKTNTPELTMSFETDNLVYGRTNNPYAHDRTSGGSSGGAAAIVAAGGAPFDLGSDTGGSIRVPSHFCGIAGLRPTSGRVSRHGHLWPPGGFADALTTLGPMARRVEDLALVLPLIAGPDGRDPAIVPAPLAAPGSVDVARLRVAVHHGNGIVEPTRETRDAVRRAADAIADAGAKVEEACPAALARTLDVFIAVMGADGGAQLEALLAEAGTRQVSPQVEGLLGTLRAAPPDPRRVWNAAHAWDVFRAEMLAFLERFDAIVCPTNAKPALPHGASPPELPAFTYTMAHNLTGWPAAVVRAGTSPEGLPIGVQLVAAPWREDVALTLAATVETRTGGWQATP
jgi:amidase